LKVQRREPWASANGTCRARPEHGHAKTYFRPK
jgi:hypothetical protein